MPATSDKQAKFFRLVLAYKIGKVKKSDVSDEIVDTANSMSEDKIREFIHESLRVPTYEEFINESKIPKFHDLVKSIKDHGVLLVGPFKKDKDGNEYVQLNYPKDYSHISGETNGSVKDDSFLIDDKSLGTIIQAETWDAPDEMDGDVRSLEDVYNFISSIEKAEKYKKLKK